MPAAKTRALTETGTDEPLDVAIPDDLDGYTGYEGIDEDALIIPRMKIVQPTSKDGTPGTFLLNLTGEEFESLESVIVIKVSRGRVMWDRDRDNDKPLCRSYDFLNPDPSLQEPQNDKCAEYITRGDKKVLQTVCPMATWGNNNERPECGEVYNLLCITGDRIPFWFAIGGASIKPVRRYISAIALRRKKLWMFETDLRLIEKKEPHKHYILDFAPPKPVPQESMEEIFELVTAFKNESIEQTLKAEEAAAKEGEEGGNAKWMDDDNKDEVPF